LIADVLSRSDPRLEQAARNLGANFWEVFRSVTLPLSRPGLAAAILMTAIYIVEDFGNPALIAGTSPMVTKSSVSCDAKATSTSVGKIVASASAINARLMTPRRMAAPVLRRSPEKRRMSDPATRKTPLEAREYDGPGPAWSGPRRIIVWFGHTARDS
ncbi:MAG: hypothetical protein C4345_06980, partial [Chloroflexota bacterium]